MTDAEFFDRAMLAVAGGLAAQPDGNPSLWATVFAQDCGKTADALLAERNRRHAAQAPAAVEAPECTCTCGCPVVSKPAWHVAHVFGCRGCAGCVADRARKGLPLLVSRTEPTDAAVERLAEVAFRAHWPTSDWAETSIGNRARFRDSIRAVLAAAPAPVVDTGWDGARGAK